MWRYAGQTLRPFLGTGVGMKSFKHYGQRIPVENRKSKIPLKWAKKRNFLGVHEDL